jgi:integrase
MQMTPFRVWGLESVRAKMTGLHKTTKRLAGGRVAVYAYAFRGGPCVARGEGFDLAGANAALERALGSRDALQRLEAARTPIRQIDNRAYVSGLILAFRHSPDFIRLGDKSKAEYVRHLAAFDKLFGAEKVVAVENATTIILDWRDDAFGHQPRTADYVMGTVGRLFTWAKGRGLASRNPVEDVPRLHKSDRSDMIWTDADLAKVCAHASVQVQHTVRLAAETGLRLGDLLALTWTEIDGAAIVKRTSKRKRQVVIPLTEEAVAVLAKVRKVSPVVLTNSRGKPWTVDGFKSVFGKAKTDAGITALRFHDLRGTAVTRMAMIPGITPADLAGVFGWAPAHVDALLAKYVSGSALALDLLERMKQKPPSTNRPQTGSTPSRLRR